MYTPQPTPKQIQALAQNTVTKVACGQNHTLALTKEGQGFSWGELPILHTVTTANTLSACMLLYTQHMMIIDWRSRSTEMQSIMALLKEGQRPRIEQANHLAVLRDNRRLCCNA